ncbi:MAG: TIM barrel protein [Pirellula sp.]
MTSIRHGQSSSTRHLSGSALPNPITSKNADNAEVVSRRKWTMTAASALAASCLTNSHGLGFAGVQALESTMPDSSQNEAKPRFGLVTYLWGKDMDLATVIKACQHSGMRGVELRTEHKHAVEPNLTEAQRKTVAKQFQESGIELVGYGSNCEFHSAKPEELRANIEQCKKYIQLMHDCGGSGVKVKPNGFVPSVPNEKTIEQIGKALNEVAAYGEGYGQQIRLEVHGGKTSQLSVIRDIFKVADHKNATVCWNCNGEDLQGPGLAANFAMVRNRFGETLHARELDSKDYPYQDLMNMLMASKYTGWVLLEARTDPADKFAAMKQQQELFDVMLSNAMKQSAKPS